MATRWTAADIPDQTGRTAVVTGANSGLGLRTAEALAAAGARVLLACRNADKAAVALEAVKAKATDATTGVKFLELAAKKGGRSVTVKYAPKVSVKGVGPRPYVRAIDGAGNRSAWRRATR